MADFLRFRPFLAGFGPAGGLWGRGKSNGPRADGAVKYRMGPWAPVMPWGIEWAPGPGPGPLLGTGTVTGKPSLEKKTENVQNGPGVILAKTRQK